MKENDMMEKVFAEYLMLKSFTKQTQDGIKGAVKRFASWSEAQNIEFAGYRYVSSTQAYEVNNIESYRKM